MIDQHESNPYERCKFPEKLQGESCTLLAIASNAIHHSEDAEENILIENSWKTSGTASA